MHIIKLISYISLFFLFGNCSEDEVVDPNVVLFEKAGSPYFITEDLEIDEEKTLMITEGAELVISNEVMIFSFGNVFIEGTEEEPVLIRGTSDAGWGQLQVKGPAEQFVVRHANIEDGTVTSFNTRNTFENVNFVNAQELTWETATARFWYGSVSITNCSIEGPNKVEGFLLHDVHDATVSDCNFFQVPDAVEFIRCKNGEIRNNTFRNCGDDAIDLNACTGTLIANNDISMISNAGMELGSENFGRSVDIMVVGNHISHCEIGLLLKQSSEATFEQDTIENSKIGIEVTTPIDSTISSTAIVKKCVFNMNDLDIFQDERSEVTIED